ncbi:MAG: endolytic transglycosylase MltG [Flavobacteriaceae bacterium]|nr:endolytic transglycosylase MltG [Flavobacteriaceae bacterium]
MIFHWFWRRFVIILALLILISGYIFLVFYQTIFADNTKFDSSQIEVHIEKDDTIDSLVLKLEVHLKSTKSFRRLSKIKSYESSIKPGRYFIYKGDNNNQIINNLRWENKPIKLVFNNQERIEDLAGRISDQIMIDSMTLLEYMTKDEIIHKKGFDRENALAMYIPNTYEVYWESDPQSITDRMYYEYHKFWNQERTSKAEALGFTPIEIMILASIVHKESTKDGEKSLIAGVYIERIRRNMKLQADPTVIYTIKKKSGDFKKVIKRVLYRDLEIDSPYNTYVYKGLPPGPLITPSIRSIESVLNPRIEGYLYFVADIERPGYHLFAKTLSQHNRNRAKYIRWINSIGIER